tara:strand:- start:5789 stop:6958 length:1170 start_codon:yes stop_codon:yes gene_type:complete
MKRIFESFKKSLDNRNGDVITFDFDNTIVKSFLNKTIDGEERWQFGGINKEIIKRIKSFKQSGKTVFVVTSRDTHMEDVESSVKSILSRLKIEVDAVFYTNGELKARKLYELGSTLHYDDDPKEREAIEAYKKLHKDFKIVVKDPEELIRDIKEISKGVVLTSDFKILIAQRSDSEEWDAPGGHIQDGEEAPFAFFREIKEELGLEVKEVQYLDTLETTWKGVTKESHYFFGRIDYSADELEGVINLQWEVSDYFCGDHEEVMRKIAGNATKNLENVMQMLQMQQELLESYQPHSKNHRTKKRILIGLGGSKTTGASGLKRVKNFKRSKSAPAGFGALEEDSTQTPSKKIKIFISSPVKDQKRKTRKNVAPCWGNSDDSNGGGGDGGGE